MIELIRLKKKVVFFDSFHYQCDISESLKFIFRFPIFVIILFIESKCVEQYSDFYRPRRLTKLKVRDIYRHNFIPSFVTIVLVQLNYATRLCEIML